MMRMMKAGRTSVAVVFSALTLLAGPFSLQVTDTPLSVSEHKGPGQSLLEDGSVMGGWPSPIAADIDYKRPDTVYVETSSSTPTGEDIMKAPSWFTSTLMARRLLGLSTFGVVSTIFPDPLPAHYHAPSSMAGQSISLKEYFADCDEALPSDTGNGGDGNPTFLALRIATTFQNTGAGSNISLSIDWWDHVNKTKPIFPGFPLSPAGLPRVTLFGYIEPFETPVPEGTEAALRSCYLDAHPDAKVWLPGRRWSPHSSYWAKMVVTQVYWIGGFGGFQQIGWMNVTEWAGIRREGSLAGIGDGRGWADVRLPGEE